MSAWRIGSLSGRAKSKSSDRPQRVNVGAGVSAARVIQLFWGDVFIYHQRVLVLVIVRPMAGTRAVEVAHFDLAAGRHVNAVKGSDCDG